MVWADRPSHTAFLHIYQCRPLLPLPSAAQVGGVEFDEHSLDGRAELDDLSPCELSLDVLRALELKGLYNSDGNILERSIAPGLKGKIPHFLKPA